MVSEIKYSGYSATPSDYECPDGDLADVIGLMPDEGSLAPIQPPVKVMDTQWDHQLMFVHKGDTYTNFIFKDGALGLFWAQQGGSPQLISTYDAEIYQVTAIGNTLVVLTSNGIFYALWKGGVEDKYINLGQMPECPISFGLQGELRRYTDLKYESGTDTHKRFEVKFNKLENSNSEEFSDENKVKVTNQVLAKVNRFVEEVSTNSNRFIFPFFVRYAYRMYDDSLTHHSAPILMLPCTQSNPKVFAYNYDTQGVGATSISLDICTIAAELDYCALIDEAQRTALAEWKDLIKSIDIFISAPIFTYDQSGYCKRILIGRGEYSPGNFVGKFIPKRTTFPTGNDGYAIKQYYQSWDISKLAAFDTAHLSSEDETHKPIPTPGTVVELPRFDESEMLSKIRECASFYFLTSIDIKDLSLTRKKVEFEDGILKALTNREAMTDDYQSHDTLIAKRALGYNGRMNLSGVQRKLFEGFDLSSMVSYVNGHEYFTDSITYAGPNFLTSASRAGEYISTYTHLKTDGGLFTLRKRSSLLMSPDPKDIYYLYYPDTSAEKIGFVIGVYANGGDNFDNQDNRRYTLEPHSFLNGAVYFSLKGDVNNYQETPVASEGLLDAKNKIYSSEVNNPFFFPLLGINAVGNGEVIGISSAAKALSQGQFGQFPLYAFTTEGVWALEVAANGSYSARQPISRDVCTRPNSITQMDNTVLFATDRGIMLLSGSEAVCISDILNSEETMSLYDLPYGRELAEQELQLDGDAIQKEPFLDFLNGLNTGMIYDYTGQRIIVYNQQKQYAYVFSLKSKRWGIMYSDIWKGIPSYPNAYAQVQGVGVVDFSIINHENVQGYFVTRPLKMETKDILKTVNTVIQRGYFNKGALKSVLWGSRDLRSWHLVASSVDHYMRGFRGTPYKYYRIGGFFQLEAKDRIFGSTVQFEPKDNNQPR